MKKLRLPTEVYVRMEEERDGAVYPMVWTEIADAIDDDGPSTIGVYKLVETRRLRKTVTTETKVRNA